MLGSDVFCKIRIDLWSAVPRLRILLMETVTFYGITIACRSSLRSR
jgi:hypothetical protein